MSDKTVKVFRELEEVINTRYYWLKTFLRKAGKSYLIIEHVQHPYDSPKKLIYQSILFYGIIIKSKIIDMDL